MSEVRALASSPPVKEPDRPLWPIAAVILFVVFAPALVAWGFTLLKP